MGDCIGQAFFLYLIGVAHGCSRSTVVRTPVRLFRGRALQTELQEYQNIAIDDVLTLKTDETVNGDALINWLDYLKSKLCPQSSFAEEPHGPVHRSGTAPVQMIVGDGPSSFARCSLRFCAFDFFFGVGTPPVSSFVNPVPSVASSGTALLS